MQHVKSSSNLYWGFAFLLMGWLSFVSGKRKYLVQISILKNERLYFWCFFSLLWWQTKSESVLIYLTRNKFRFFYYEVLRSFHALIFWNYSLNRSSLSHWSFVYIRLPKLHELKFHVLGDSEIRKSSFQIVWVKCERKFDFSLWNRLKIHVNFCLHSFLGFCVNNTFL